MLSAHKGRMGNPRGKTTDEERIAFMKVHKDLFKTIFFSENASHRKAATRIITEKARAEFGYSKLYINQDILAKFAKNSNTK